MTQIYDKALLLEAIRYGWNQSGEGLNGECDVWDTKFSLDDVEHFLKQREITSVSNPSDGKPVKAGV